MRARRIWASVAVTVMAIGAVSLSAAPAASAASLNLTVDCSQPYEQVTLPYGVSPGDTFSVAYGNCPTAAVVPTRSEITGSNWVLEQDYGFAITYDLDATSGTATFLVVGSASPGDFLFGFGATNPYNDRIIILQGEGPVPIPVMEDPTPIPAWVQAYGRAGSDATCLEGWDPSWDLWPNDGKGGFVCQRSIPSLG